MSNSPSSSIRTNCGKTCTLCPDVVATYYAPEDDQPRELTCGLAHPHPPPHMAEGWAWHAGTIWKVGVDDAASK